MSRLWWGWTLPLVLTGAASGAALLALPAGPARRGVLLGLGLALLQSAVSVAALKKAWKTQAFYWVWGGGMAARLLVFAGTAAVTHGSAAFGFAATLVTLAVATMVLLVSESLIFFSKS